MPINFFNENEEIVFSLRQPTQVKNWLKEIAKQEGYKIDDLNYIFCTDEFLLKMNEEYLQHDTYTDIITFDLSEDEGGINGEIYISLERVADNAKKFKTEKEDELHRVIVHGLLHLVGYKDKNHAEKAGMREKEDACLALRGF